MRFWKKIKAGRVTPVRIRPRGRVYDLPLVVLVYGGKASVPEIIAGALQDSGRSTIVGEKAFGMGTMLEKISLSDGSALLLPVQEWLTSLRHYTEFFLDLFGQREKPCPKGLRGRLPKPRWVPSPDLRYSQIRKCVGKNRVSTLPAASSSGNAVWSKLKPLG